MKLASLKANHELVGKSSKSGMPDVSQSFRVGKLNLVALAGSERVSVSDLLDEVNLVTRLDILGPDFRSDWEAVGRNEEDQRLAVRTRERDLGSSRLCSTHSIPGLEADADT